MDGIQQKHFLICKTKDLKLSCGALITIDSPSFIKHIWKVHCSNSESFLYFYFPGPLLVLLISRIHLFVLLISRTQLFYTFNFQDPPLTQSTFQTTQTSNTLLQICAVFAGVVILL